MPELAPTVAMAVSDSAPNRHYSFRFSFSSFLLVALAWSITVPTATASTPRGAPVVLPIEVIGSDGHIESVTVDIADPSGVNRLWIQGNGMSFVYSTQTKASVRVNNGSWIPLNNSTVTCDYPDNLYDCIDGGRSTIKFSLPVTGVVAGLNNIDFRFNGTDGMSIGWRVVDFNFLRGNDSKVLPASAFVRDDANNWVAPRPSSADIAQGKQLWETANLVDSSLPGAPTIRAKCADCHDSSGHDLKYFAFSNKSIVERSVFHGLSRVDGEKIASFIRTLPGQAYGTPWNPPYQPGPGIDSKPAREWAAGAGLEMVLDKDSDMIPYVFPDSDRRAVTDTKSTLNMREIPVAFQLPDWNDWLPRIHPVDAYGDAFLNSPAYQSFLGLEVAMAGYPNTKSLDETGIAALVEYVDNYNRNWGISDGEYTNHDQVDANFSFRQWKLVKFWELFQKYELEDKVAELYPADSRGIEQGEARGWPGITPPAFGVAPHRIVAQSAGLGPYRNEATNLYFSTGWYQLQAVLNAGFRLASEQNVVDWKYHMPHIRSVQAFSGHDQTVRYLTSYMKRLQLSDNVKGADYNYGWQWRINNPIEVWYGAVGNGSGPGSLNQQEYKDLIEPILHAWIAKTEEFVPDDWCRELGALCLTPSNYTPIPYTGSGYFLRNSENATQMYRLIPELDRIGVDSEVLGRMATWFTQAWPNTDWHALYSGGNQNSNSSPTVSLTSPQDNASFSVEANVSIRANATDADGSIGRVEFYVDNNRVSTDTSAPFEYNWVASSPGDFVIVARAFDNDGAQTNSDSRSVSVTNAASQQQTQSIVLQQGWNLVSSYVVPGNANLTSVFEAIESDILLVKDQSGGQYHPPSGLNTIGNWDPTEAYEVYASSPQTLRITGNPMNSASAISMSSGWNHLSYIRAAGMPIEQALSSIGGKINIVKDAGGKVYYPAYSINEIGTMLPGQGYKVHLSSSASLTYPTSSSKGAGSAGSMSSAVASSGLLIVETPRLADGIRVVVSSTAGVVAGEGLVAGGRAVVHLNGDDLFTSSTKEGVSDGDVLHIRFKDELDNDLEDVSVSGVRDGLTDDVVADALIRYTNDAVLIASVSEVPQETTLEQNFPNPFYSETSITYSLPEDSHVVLDVYNIAGQHVARLIEGEESAGWHAAELDARGLASGVYLYRLVTDDTVVHKQMLLRK